MMTPTILFDLDGTLVDTARDLVEALNAVLDHHGRTPVSVDEGRLMVGYGGRALLKHGFAATGTPADDGLLDTCFPLFLEKYEAHLTRYSTLYPGLVAQLTSLVEEGIQLGVVTNKPERLARLVLTETGIDHYFSALIGGDTLAEKKPHPAPLIAALNQMGGSAAHALMVGDSQIDKDSAQAARMVFIGVSFGYSKPPMAALEPDGLLNHYDDLPAVAHHLRPLDFSPPS
ncbi:MAG: HAD family hydrolase [Parvularculales bacterium]